MNDQQFGGYLSLLIVAFVALVVLVVIVILQNRKIKTLETPRYGFLGKSLSYAFLFAMFAGGSLFLALAISNSNRTNTPSVNVTDKQDVKLKITYNIANTAANLYQFNVTPFVDNRAWGTATLLFSINWTLELGDGSVKTFTEKNLNATNTGGITQQLTPGVNIITVNFEANGKIFKDEITIVVK